MWFLFFAAIHFAQAAGGNTSGAFYKYVDEKGTIVFVDSHSKVPPQFRERVETLAGIAAKPKTKLTVFVFKPNARYIIIASLLNDRIKAKLLIDPTAERSSMGLGLAQSLGFDPKDPEMKMIDIVGAGSVEKVPLVKLDSVDLQGRVAQNVYMLIQPSATTPDYQGVLGKDFINRFKTSFDYMKGTFTMEDKAPSNEPTP